MLPFDDFARSLTLAFTPRSALREAITAAWRRPETECLPPLIEPASRPPARRARARELAARLVEALRAKAPSGGVEGLIHEYALSSQEGVALMCLAEALLRIPDDDTRDALIRDKIGGGDWRAHLGHSPSLFVNAATWGLVVTGRLASTTSERSLSGALTRLIGKGGEPLIRAGVNMAMRLMGERFVAGQTIEEALSHDRSRQDQGFRHSYDMLGEAAVTAGQAEAYLQAYRHAIQAIGKAAGGRGIYEGSGISIKLSALHPRYSRAQLDGLDDYPVFTRRIHTDVSYLACARRLLAAPDAASPQFGTHNALTLATLHAMAGENFYAGQYEFQCLHGMGEPLYEEVVGTGRLNRPCRIYTPVGTHETLLAYLVRRLLENGANTSFVNQIADPAVTLDRLLADPVETAKALVPVGAPHPRIVPPRDLFGSMRRNSRGLDLANEQVLESLAPVLQQAAPLAAVPMLAAATTGGEGRPVANPADPTDIVGTVTEATPEQVDAACAAARPWQDAPSVRAATLRRAADLMDARLEALLGPIVREAGKTLGNAIGEVREAVDFLRYYAGCVDGFANDTHRPLGLVACISPWNFPLSIFTGQVAGALAAGNAVIAKPAEETPLIASLAVALLHEAGVPRSALQFVPGDGRIGAHLVGNAAVAGVVFTGSTEAAQSINRTLARRLNADGRPPVLIAETGGQNALVADSSALSEQLVLDAVTSAFDSAGQRCSALRVLCLQDDIAGHVVPLLKGAMAELSVGNPDRLSVDVGPVISAEAKGKLDTHIERMRSAGHAVHQVVLPPTAAHGTFVPPTLIEIDAVSDLPGEVFGPVLHVLPYRREDVDAVVQAVNATGFGLTFGVHSRIDETIARLTEASDAGNQYVNRNMIGAVVGVQPFGGHGLSGTGPKAGGPLYVHRLLAQAPALTPALGELPGPVGERNLYRRRPKGTILCVAPDSAHLDAQRATVAATGNRATTDAADSDIAAALFAGSADQLVALNRRLAARPGRIVPVYVEPYPLALLSDEVSLSENTAAAGGNASLMTIG